MAMQEDEIRRELLHALTVENKMVTFLWLSAKFNIHVNAAKRILDSFYKECKNDENLYAMFYLSGYQKIEENQLQRVFFVNEDLLQEHMHMLDEILSCHVYCVHTSEINDIIGPYLSDTSISLPPELCAMLPLAGESETKVKCSASPRPNKFEQALTRDNVAEISLKGFPTEVEEKSSSSNSEEANSLPFNGAQTDDGEIRPSKVISVTPLSNDVFTTESSPENSQAKASDIKENKLSNEKKRRPASKRKGTKDNKLKRSRRVSAERSSRGSSYERDKSPGEVIVPLEKQATSNETSASVRSKTNIQTFIDDDDYLVTKRIRETETINGKEPAPTDQQGDIAEESKVPLKSAPTRKGATKASPKRKQNPLTRFFKKL
uniref:DNA polymerase delta subunit 3 n=1 Tax=Trichuris muris TaxID=70415 RepID=A0A5S6R0X0_TRIMR